MADLFFIQRAPKEPWHIETADDCEVMICGAVISADLSTVRVQRRWGPRRCPDCWIEQERREKIAHVLAPRPRRPRA